MRFDKCENDFANALLQMNDVERYLCHIKLLSETYQ